MNVTGRTVFVFLFVGAATLSSPWPQPALAQTPTYSVEAVARNGMAINPPVAAINSNRGDTLTLEVYVRNWSSGGASLKGYQFSFDATGFTSGSAGNVNPKDFATTTDLNGCANEMGPSNGANAFIDTNKASFVHLGLDSFFAVNSEKCGYQYGSAVSGPGPASSPGVKKYCGTLNVQVSNDASGTFTVRLDQDPVDSFIGQGSGQMILPLNFEALTINVVPSVDLGIVSSDPPNNAIDARWTSNLDGSNPTGFTSITLVFNDDTSGLTPADFTISVNPPGPAPGVASVVPNGNMITVNFTTFIPPGKWTTITHVDDTPTQVRLGYLTGDVNNNRTSNSIDILDLINGLNGILVLQPYQRDVNRSGVFNSQDILALVDALNGAGALDVWNGRSLP